MSYVCNVRITDYKQSNREVDIIVFNINTMSHQFYDYETLDRGTQQMVGLIKELYSQTDAPVHPEVKPGFLRHALP